MDLIAFPIDIEGEAMRKELRKVLVRMFTEELSRHDNTFVAANIRSKYLTPGEKVYEKAIPTSAKRLFIVLIADNQRDAFMVEIGWSTLGRFPELPMRPSGWPMTGREEFKKPEFMCRVASLFDPAHNFWYIRPALNPFKDDFLEYVKEQTKTIPPDTAAALVKPAVLDAIDKLVKFGFPYLDEYLSAG